MLQRLTYADPVSDKSGEVITKAIVDYATDAKVTAPRVRYTVTPDPVDADPDDNFGFNEAYSEFTDGKSRNPVTNQTSKFDGMADAMDVSTDIIKPLWQNQKSWKRRLRINCTQKDYEYTRGNLYSLIDKGQEAT